MPETKPVRLGGRPGAEARLVRIPPRADALLVLRVLLGGPSLISTPPPSPLLPFAGRGAAALEYSGWSLLNGVGEVGSLDPGVGSRDDDRRLARRMRCTQGGCWGQDGRGRGIARRWARSRRRVGEGPPRTLGLGELVRSQSRKACRAPKGFSGRGGIVPPSGN